MKKASNYYASCQNTDNLENLFTIENMLRYDCFKSTDKNLILKEKNGIKELHASSKEQLIEYLTTPKNDDIVFMKKLLLTYESIFSNEELLSLLRLKYNTPPPKEEISDEDFQEFYKKELSISRLLISQFIVLWLTDYEIPTELLKEFEDFCDEMKKTGMEAASLKISKLLKKGKVKHDIDEIIFDPKIPIDKDVIHEKTPKEIAEQLTIFTHYYFQKLKPYDFLNLNWTKQDTRAENLKYFIQRANIISGWVSTLILEERNIDDRINMLSKFILIAEEARKLQNFNLTMEILSSFNSSSVFRLKKTFAGLSKEQHELFLKLNQICDSKNGFRYIRNEIKNSVPPCIPFIGIYLTDLTFIEDGNHNYVDGLIHWTKRDLCAGIIRSLQFFQQEKYQIKPHPLILKYLSTIDEMRKTTEQLYSMSLEIEKRDDSDELPKKSFGDQVKSFQKKSRSFSVQTFGKFNLRGSSSNLHDSPVARKDSAPSPVRKDSKVSQNSQTSDSPLIIREDSVVENSSVSIMHYSDITPSFDDTDGADQIDEECFTLNEVLAHDHGKPHFVQYLQDQNQDVSRLDFITECQFMKEFPANSPSLVSCCKLIAKKYLSNNDFITIITKDLDDTKSLQTAQYIEEYIMEELNKPECKVTKDFFNPILFVIESQLNEIYTNFVRSDRYRDMVEIIQELDFMKNMVATPIDGPLMKYLNITEESEVVSLVKKMRAKKTGITGFGKGFLYQFKYYNNCFKGSSMVSWLKTKYSIKTDEAVEIGNQLVNESYLHHIGDLLPFSNTGDMFRFTMDDNIKVLNTHRKHNEIPLSAIVVSQRIQNSQLSIQAKYITDKGVDYELLKKSTDFKEFVNITIELQTLSIGDLSEVERKCFFINTYNSLVIHAFVVHGAFKNPLERSKFFGMYKYDIGGLLYSLNDIVHGILRSNSPGPGSSKSHYFAKNDKRLDYIIQQKDPRIHFALVCGAKSSPIIRCFNPKNLEIGLNLASSNYLDQEVGIMTNNTVVLSMLLKWYKIDFGRNNEEVCKFIVEHLGESETRDTITRLLNRGSPIKLKYSKYNWSVNNSSEIY
eukprot:gene11836-5166_t